MNALIPLTEHEGVQAVTGRDLHGFLEVRDNYTDWMKRMIAYGFTSEIDFSEISDKPSGAGRPRVDHIITLDMAKEISMIQRTDKGKQARQYFIECERQAKNPTAELSRLDLLQMAVDSEKQRIALESRNKELEAPAKSWNDLAAPGGDYSVAAAAKVLSRDPNIEIGRDRLFAHMKHLGWIFKTSGKRAHWEAYQDKGIKTGRLVHKLGGGFINEKTGDWEQASPTVRITPKGLHELHVSLGGSDQIGIGDAA